MNNNLRDLFQQPFDLETYRRVILSQLLHAQRLLTSPEMLEQYDNGDQLYGLGYLTDNEGKEIGLYYTHVPNGDVRRKRVGFRKMLHPYVKYGVDAAIAVFDDGEYWRLSYICDLKGGVTSAKRFSYVFGDPKGQYNTPVGRLTDLAKKRLTLDELHKTFSVDALSKEFFDEYHRHYDRIIAELSRQGNTGAVFHDYVKKMMGRIVFLHFLQKKRWLNDDPEFLSKLFFLSPYKQDFLDQELEPLFFGIFNTEPDKREQLFHQEHWDLRWLTEWEKLPYLNGGLFERDEVDKMKIKLPASLFENLFRFMASYNFTIDENDPDDADIGIDPEMLGKNFESLLEDNKAKGAFYTPKEIVRYMCKESLIAYLDSKLENSCDVQNALERQNARSANNPTQGTQCGDNDRNEKCVSETRDLTSNGENSGGLPDASARQDARSANNPTQGTQCGDNDNDEKCVSETRDLKTAIRAFVEHHEMQPELESYRDTLDAALRNVKICDPAIGSGAFPMGLLNELWRCREALMDAADTSERCDFSNTVQAKRSAVTSTESPLRAGGTRPQSRVDLKKEIIENNIYGVDIERGAIDIARLRFWLSIVVDAEEPEPLPNFDYKFMQGNSLIESYKGIDLSRISNRLRGGQSKSTQLLLGLDSDFSKKNLQLLIRDYFKTADHKQKSSMRQAINDEVKRLITDFIGGTAADLNKLDPSANQDFFLWHTWFKDIFDNGGFDIVIGNPPYGATIKDNKEFYKINYKCTEGKYELYKYFFEKATMISSCDGIIAFITPDTWKTLGYFRKMRELLLTKCTLLSITESLYDIFISAKVDTVVTILKMGRQKNSKYYFVSSDLKTYAINDFLPSGDYIISNVSHNPILIKLSVVSSSLGTIAEIWQGLIAYAGKDQPRIWSSLNKETPYHKKLLYGKDISKYAIHWGGEYLKYGEWLHRPRPSYIFETEKILVQRIRNPKLKTRLVCTYDDKGYINGTGLSNIILLSDYKDKISLKYILGLLNSSLINYWFSLCFVDVNIKPEQLRKIPILIASFEQQKSISDKVNKILWEKTVNVNADTSALEHQIDELVYQLYNLTPEEIAIIEQ